MGVVEASKFHGSGSFPGVSTSFLWKVPRALVYSNGLRKLPPDSTNFHILPLVSMLFHELPRASGLCSRLLLLQTGTWYTGSLQEQ